MALTKANTKGKIRRPQQTPTQTPGFSPTPEPWGGIDIPSQSPQPGFQFGASPWVAIADALKPQAQAPIDYESIFSAMRNDPQGDANKGYIPGTMNESNPFSNGFFNHGAAQLSPEGQLATQGRSALNQWGQLGVVPGVDPSALKGAMGQMTPLPGPAATPNPGTSDPFFTRRHQQQWPEAYGQAPQPQAGMDPKQMLAMLLNQYGVTGSLTGRQVLGDESGPRFQRPR